MLPAVAKYLMKREFQAKNALLFFTFTNRAIPKPEPLGYSMGNSATMREFGLWLSITSSSSLVEGHNH